MKQYQRHPLMLGQLAQRCFDSGSTHVAWYEKRDIAFVRVARSWLLRKLTSKELIEYLETVIKKGDRYYYKYGSEDRPMVTTEIAVPLEQLGCR